MSTTPILTLPPAEITGRAASILAANSAGNTPRIHALNKAAYHLALGDLAIVPNFDGFLIASATRAGLIHRVSPIHGCSCEAGRAGKVCWHAMAVEILGEAGKYTMPKIETANMGQRIATARTDAYHKALAEMDELFPR